MMGPRPKMSERDWQALVIDTARLYGWRVAHFRTSPTASGGWATAVAADGAGFPDLVLVHPRRGDVVFAELKTNTGRLSDAQREWHEALTIATVENAHVAGVVWRPREWDARVLPTLRDGVA